MGECGHGRIAVEWDVKLRTFDGMLWAGYDAVCRDCGDALFLTDTGGAESAEAGDYLVDERDKGTATLVPGGGYVSHLSD